MKKLLVNVLSGVLSLSLLAGCSGGAANPPASEGAAPPASTSESSAAAGDKGEPEVTSDSVGYPDATIELTWLPQEAFDSPNKPVADYFKECAVKFVKAHPEVRIRLTAQTVNIQDAMAKLLIQASSGSAPDLASVDSFILPSYWQYLQPVDDVLEENGISLDSWFPFAQAMMKPEDKTLAMWYDTDVRALYYQKSLMDAPPADWDALISTAEGLKDQGYMFLYPAGKNETTSCDVWPWFWAQGGEIVDDSGKPVFNEGDNRTYMLNTFNFLKKTIDSGITPSRVTSFMTDGDMNEDVASGKVAMFVGGSWLAKQIGAIIGDDVFTSTYGIAPLPVSKDGQQKTTSGGWTCGVFSKDDNIRKLAAQFAIDTYISDEANDAYAAASGNLPCRQTIYTTSERLKSDPTALAFGELLKDGAIRPGVEIYNFISTEFQVAISDVISGAATPEQALDKMAENVDAEYAKK